MPVESNAVVESPGIDSCGSSLGSAGTTPAPPLGRRNRHRLSLLTLENRDVPAAWYTIQLNSPPQGTLGESAAHISSGGLTVDSSYDPDGDGTALVYADSGSEAIRLALAGAVTVDLSVANLPQTEYAFSLGTSSLVAADHKAFLLAKLPTSPPPPPGPPNPDPIPETMAFATTPGDPDAGVWRINLEDLAAHPTVSDWDYNDFFWNVTVAEAAWPSDTLALVGVEAVESSVTEMSGTPTTLHFTVSATGPNGPVGEPIAVTYSAYQLDTGEPVQAGTVTIPAGQSAAALTLSIPTATDPTGIRQFGVVLDEAQAAGIRVAPDASQANVFVYPPVSPPSVSVVVAERELFAEDPTEALTVDTALVRTNTATMPLLTDVRYEVTLFEGPNADVPVSQEILTATFDADESYAPLTLNLGASQTAGTSERKVRLRVLPPTSAGSSPPYAPDTYASESWTVVRRQPDLTPPAPEDLEWNDVVNAAGEAGVSGALSTWEATVAAGVSVALDVVIKTVIARKASADWTMTKGVGHPALDSLNPNSTASYTRNEKLKLPEVKVLLPFAQFVPPKNQVENTIRIRGKTRAVGEGAVDPALKFGWAGDLKPTITVSTGGQQTLSVKNVFSDAGLPAAVNVYKFVIDWEISWNGDGNNRLWCKVGNPNSVQNPRTVYTTYAKPNFAAASNVADLGVPRSLIISGTKALAGTTPANDAAVVEAVFSLFQEKTFTDANGKKPGYYTSWDGKLRDAGGANLVANTPGEKNGNCIDWSNLLVLLLEGQGINMKTDNRGVARFHLPGGPGNTLEYFLVAGQWDFKADAKLNPPISRVVAQ